MRSTETSEVVARSEAPKLTAAQTPFAILTALIKRRDFERAGLEAAEMVEGVLRAAI